MLSLALALTLAARPDPLPIGATVADFAGRDARGADVSLADYCNQIVVVAFLGVECPLAKLYGPRLAELSRAYAPRGVALIAVDANAGDAATAIARFIQDFGLPFPVLKDATGEIADRFRAHRTPEVFVLDRSRRLRYRGRIDGQYEPGVQRPTNPRADLVLALDDLLADRNVAVPVTEANGCVIARPGQPAVSGAITYARDVAPILNRRCVSCHRPGEVGPFALTTYKNAAGWAETIREVVADGRMPPWHANPQHGRFANDPRLSDAEKRTLGDWADAGCPEGDPADVPPLPTFPDGWAIEPDAVYELPKAIELPATGVIEYQYVVVDPGFTHDVWVRAAEVRPGNRAVVHHVNVFLQAPWVAGGDSGKPAWASGGWAYLSVYTPGTPPLQLPPGSAMRVPAGWKLLFSLHYAATGKPETDRTRLGLTFADPATVRQEVMTQAVEATDFAIPPHAADFRLERSNRLPCDATLLALLPHMHLRGKSYRFEAIYPCGSREILLDVPRYHVAWQHRYVLAEPKRLPAGTELRASATYDNSAANPINPDPSVTVRFGEQTTDEMFLGYYEIALDATQPRPRWPWWAAMVLAGLLLARRVRSL